MGLNQGFLELSMVNHIILSNRLDRKIRNMSKEVERPRCPKCKFLMRKNGKFETENGVMYRFRCGNCGTSVSVLQSDTQLSN